MNVREELEQHHRWLKDTSQGKPLDLTGQHLNYYHLAEKDFTRVVMRGVHLMHCDLRRTKLAKVDATCADFAGSDLSHAVLDDALLNGVSFRGANLTGTSLRGAVLTQADFGGARLCGTDFSCADMRGANLSSAFLDEVTGLDTAQLGDTCFALVLSPWDWVDQHGHTVGLDDSRLRAQAMAQRQQPYAGLVLDEPGYYEAPVFSRDGSMHCHPGLYVASAPADDQVPVSFWLDEAVVTPSTLRVPRLMVLPADR